LAGLERLEQQLQRLQRLMRKEALMMMAALCHTAGCLSWEQLALSAVLCMPTPCSLHGLSEAVSRQVRQRRQQELQQLDRQTSEQLWQQQKPRQQKQHGRQPHAMRSGSGGSELDE
jgi:uncharacterized protein YqcC (DUF446 family)